MHGEPLLAAAHDIRTGIAVEIGDLQFDPDARVVVDEVRDEFDLLLRVEGVAEPIEDRFGERAWILPLVGEMALPRDEVHASVAVHVGESEGVQLRESETEGILGRAFAHEVVLLELARLILLKPAEPVAVGVVGTDEIHVAVAVEVVHEDLSSPSAVGQVGPFVFLPRSLRRIGGLLVPESLLDDIGAPVTVEIADAETMTKGRCRFTGFGNGMPGPGFRRIFPSLVVAVGFFAGSDDFRESTRDQVDKVRRFVRDLVGDEMHLPIRRRRRIARIQVKTRLFPRKAVDEEVVLSVFVHVLDVGEEIVRVALLPNEGLARGETLRLGEVGTREPEGAVGEIGFAIAVEIADGGTFGVEVREESF